MSAEHEQNIVERLPIPITRGGGKLEGTRALEEKGFPVPKSRYLYFEDLNKPRLVAAAFRDLRGPLIVRGSHPNDWHGYIDVLPTKRNVTSEEELQHGINYIARKAASEDIRRHAEDWGQPFSKEVHVLVQEQSKSPIAGSMLRHPHNLDQIDMNYADRNQRPYKNLSFAHIREDGFMHIKNWGKDITKEEIKEATKAYEDVEKSGLVDPAWVYQMEIGLDPFMIFQLRPFKMRQPVKNFTMPESEKVDYPVITSRFVFGITPPQGVRLNFVASKFWDIENDHQRVLPRKGPYGLILTDTPRGSLSTNVMLGELAVILSKSFHNQYLEHGDYRLLKKSQFGLLYYNAHNAPMKENGFIGDNEDFTIFSDSHLWSNGDHAVMMPAQFAEKL